MTDSFRDVARALRWVLPLAAAISIGKLVLFYFLGPRDLSSYVNHLVFENPKTFAIVVLSPFVISAVALALMLLALICFRADEQFDRGSRRYMGHRIDLDGRAR